MMEPQLAEVAVYRLYGAAGNLLYVGTTAHLRRRLVLHSRKPWWSDVVRVEFDVVSKDLGLWVERWQISRLAPLHNKLFNSRRGWDFGPPGSGPGLRYFRDRDEFAVS